MMFELFMPYFKGASIDMKDNLNGYYKTEQEYADALVNEDKTGGAMVYDTLTGGGFRGDTYYGYNGWAREDVKKEDKIAWSKAECQLLTPDAEYLEDVDTMIDKFAKQKEFLVTAHFNMKDVEPEFEEEIREWAKETLNIYIAGDEMVKKGYSSTDKDRFLEEHIPRRELRLSFKNKSGKMVNFCLKSCEIERKIARNRYLLYVKRMEMLK